MSLDKYYLNLLPLEIKFKICSFLNTYDILELSRALPDFEFCMLEKKLSRFVNLYKEYRLKICDLTVIFKGLRSEFITYLNINCVYWIPYAEIKKCLLNLKSLECFYAVDTKMNVTNSNCLSHLLNLQRIALSLDGHMDSEVVNNFPRTITHLCLHINKSTQETISRLAYLLHNLQKLEELWIIDLTSTSTESTSMRALNMLPKNVKKYTFFVQSIPNIVFLNQLYISNGVVTTFRSKNRGYEVIIEKHDITKIRDIYSEWTFENRNWDVLINCLKMELPFCPHDTNLLIQKKADLTNIKFRELNLCHSPIHCSKLFKSNVKQLLKEPNVERLNKLSINLCILELIVADRTESIQEPLFKRNKRESRINPIINDNSCIVNDVLSFCPYLEELELWECRSQPTNVLLLKTIRNLKHLRKLTLDGIPTHIPGNFLIDVCKSCTNLESLRIKTDKQNSNMNNSVCAALTHANHLKDFRYENPYIPIDKIFDSLGNTSKLERLVIKCKSVETFSVLPFNEFLKNNLHLKFICIIIKEIPKVNIRNISQALNQYKNSLEKIFIIAQDETLINNRPSIPNIHKYEMLYFYSQICNLDLFNGFVSMK